MSEPVKPRRMAIAAGVVVALYVVTSFLAREVPDWMVSALGGPIGGVDRIGGLRIHYRPPAGEVEVFDYPGVTADQVPDIVDVLVGGGLSMREALETDFAERTGIPLARDPGLDPQSVAVEIDQWRPEDGGVVHTVHYVMGPTREAIERELAARGVAPAEGASIVFERVEPWDASSGERPYWRTYEVADEVLIDGSMIDSAVGSYDPNTNRPIVLLDFTKVGAQRFCNATSRIVGRKLATILGGRVRSAPIINGPICGGRASITMGGPDPEVQDRERDALVAVLQHGALPVGGVIERKELVPPPSVAVYEWAARLLLGGLSGLIAGLLTWLAIAFAKPRKRPPPEGAANQAFPWRRLWVTLLAPAALIALGMVDLPFTNPYELAHIVQGYSGDQFTVIALGVMPILTAFLIVELVALAVPPWRWRRHDVRGRIGLGKAVAVVSVLIALVQGYFVATYLESLSRSGAEVMMNPGWKTRLAVMASLATGTMLLGVVAGLIREHGLGNGYGALMASSSVLALVQPILRAPLEIAGTVGHADLVAVITATAIAAATACVLRWRIAGEAREPELRVPSSGISPVSDAGGLVVIIAGLSALGLGVALYDAIDWVTELRARTWLMIGILVASIPVYAWLFARPGVVERVAMQAGLDRPSHRTWLRATTVTMWLIAGLALLAQFAIVRDGLQQSLADAIGVMVCTAVVLDIVADARAHRRKLAPAGVIHQIQYAGVVERVLADAGIPCHLHASALRTLLAFFGPFAPVIVMVPEEHAAAARTRVDDVLRAATSKPPVALLQVPPT